MATSLAEIRAKLKQQEQGGNRPKMDGSVYPFWNMEEGSTTTLRFLPDDNPNNSFFWIERLMIKLPFSGIKGQPDSRPVLVQVPCMEMYDQPCPVLGEVRNWFKDPSLEDLGRKYWKKRSYIFQGFVVDGGIDERDGAPENPIRRFVIGPQLFQVIKQALMDPDMEDLPTDFVNGIDFRLNKTSKGGYADYSTSTWARRERPLSDEEKRAIDEHGLFDLSEFIPKKPDEAAVQVIKEMFEASVDGEPYDEERWGNYFRPGGMAARTGDPQSKPAAQTSSAKEDKPPFTPDDKPAENNETNESSNSSQEQESSNSEGTEGAAPQDILAMIRARKNQ